MPSADRGQVPTDELLARLRRLGDPRNVAGMARYGIHARHVYGVPLGRLRGLAREIGKDHRLAPRLWATGVYDARLLAVLIEDPARVSRRQMESWAKGFDNWAITDGCCLHLFARTPFAWDKAREWSARREEFVKRAGFTLMAVLAVHDKRGPDAAFLALLRLVEREAGDERNGVKKAVNWALRQIGKRNLALHRAAVRTAMAIRRQGTRSARWIASDALRELQSGAVRERLRRKRVTSGRPRGPASESPL